MSLFEDGLYTFLSAQSNITAIVADRIYPVTLPQDPVLPAIVFTNMGTYPVAMLSSRPVLDRSKVQFDCYAPALRDAKLIADAIRASLEGYVGAMGAITARAAFCETHSVDDFDDVPGDFRVMSEFEIWHTI